MAASFLPLPAVGQVISVVHMSLLYSLYSFEYKWINMGKFFCYLDWLNSKYFQIIARTIMVICIFLKHTKYITMYSFVRSNKTGYPAMFMIYIGKYSALYFKAI